MLSSTQVLIARLSTGNIYQRPNFNTRPFCCRCKSRNGYIFLSCSRLGAVNEGGERGEEGMAAGPSLGCRRPVTKSGVLREARQVAWRLGTSETPLRRGGSSVPYAAPKNDQSCPQQGARGQQNITSCRCGRGSRGSSALSQTSSSSVNFTLPGINCDDIQLLKETLVLGFMRIRARSRVASA